METIKDVDDEDPNQIYLVDHAWTFRTDQARQQLCQVPGLASRIAASMDIEEEDDEVVVETVLEKMWRFVRHTASAMLDLWRTGSLIGTSWT